MCHDHDTGRELAVKVVDIDHIDHSTPTTDSWHMQRVRMCVCMCVCGCGGMGGWRNECGCVC